MQLKSHTKNSPNNREQEKNNNCTGGFPMPECETVVLGHWGSLSSKCKLFTAEQTGYDDSTVICTTTNISAEFFESGNALNKSI